MIDEPGEALAGHAAGKPVEVVQDQRDLTQIVQLVHQARQHHVHDRCRPDHLRRRRQADGRAGPAKRLDHIGPEHHRVVVALVQRQPRDRLPRRLNLPPLRQQGGLPVTRRTCHQAEPQTRPGPKRLRKPLTRNDLIAHRRRAQFRRDQDRPRAVSHTVPHRPPSARNSCCQGLGQRRLYLIVTLQFCGREACVQQAKGPLTGCLLSVMSADAQGAFPFLPAFVRNARSRAAATRAAGTRRACGSVIPSPRRTPAQWHGGASPLLADLLPLGGGLLPHLRGGHRVFQELPAHRSPAWQPSSPPASLPMAATMSTAAIFS